MATNRPDIELRKQSILEILQSVYPEETEITRASRVEQIAQAALDERSFNDAFDTEVRGRQLDLVPILKELLLAAQIVLVLVELAKQLGKETSRKEFKKRAREKSHGEINVGKFREIIDKVYELVFESGAPEVKNS